MKSWGAAWQAMMLADLREQLDGHGLAQAQDYLNEKLRGDGSAIAKRLVESDPVFCEVSLLRFHRVQLLCPRPIIATITLPDKKRVISHA